MSNDLSDHSDGELEAQVSMEMLANSQTRRVAMSLQGGRPGTEQVYGDQKEEPEGVEFVTAATEAETEPP